MSEESPLVAARFCFLSVNQNLHCSLHTSFGVSDHSSAVRYFPVFSIAHARLSQTEPVLQCSLFHPLTSTFVFLPTSLGLPSIFTQVIFHGPPSGVCVGLRNYVFIFDFRLNSKTL